MQAEHIFVAGSDTGAGKTLFTAMLGKFLLSRGETVVTQKWIQTGSVRPDDVIFHQKFMGTDKTVPGSCHKYTCPYTFKYPASPHLAAEIDGQTISRKVIISAFRKLAGSYNRVIVEGTGGLLVPYNRKNTIADIVKQLDLTVILVIGNRLGAINHALLSISEMDRMKIRCHGLVFNNMFPESGRILEDNMRIISRFSGKKVLCVIPYRKKTDKSDLSAIKEINLEF